MKLKDMTIGQRLAGLASMLRPEAQFSAEEIADARRRARAGLGE